MAILLDLKKSIPKSKSTNTMGLTGYRVRGEEKDSTKFIPQRGLREGCATSGVTFSIFHQAVSRVAEREEHVKRRKGTKK